MAASNPANLSTRRVLHTWWPLAASWLLMSGEQPAATVVIARLAHPEIHLAAWQVVFSLSLVVEAPIIMLLAASTALSRDWESYLWLRRFMLWAGATLTAVHLLVAFTPLYYVVVGQLIGQRPDVAAVADAARPGLMLMTPWSWAIAYRRFHQGVLIRFGHSRAVGFGTIVRLGTEVGLLGVGYVIHTLPGAVVAGGAIAAGVLGEALYTGVRVRPVLREQVRRAPPAGPGLTLRGFLSFYIPLSLTSLLFQLVTPIITFALSRMPGALDSLDVWPVNNGLIFILRSVGIAYNEAVVALLDERGAFLALRRVAAGMAATTSTLMLLMAATPFSAFWFSTVSALSPPLAALARQAFWLALPLPGLSVLQSWYQGRIVHSRHTRGITEAMAVYLLSSSAVMVAGTVWWSGTGLYVGMVGYTAGSILQTAWLWYRSRATRPSAQL